MPWLSDALLAALRFVFLGRRVGPGREEPADLRSEVCGARCKRPFRAFTVTPPSSDGIDPDLLNAVVPDSQDTQEFAAIDPEAEEERGLASWVFFAGDFKKPVKIPLEYDIVGALWAADRAAWCAVIEFVQGHLAAREDSAD